MFTLTAQAIVAYAFGLLLIYLIAQSFLTPLKYVGWVLWNGLLGGLALLAINFVGTYVGFHIGLNPVSALVAGVLGIPGIVLLFALRSVVG